MTSKVKATINIVNWITGSVIYESTKETIKEAVVDAVAAGANLYGANLHGANLYGANLHGADLYGADLYGADLRRADLRRADLRSANLRGANLYGANLHGADLYGADLCSANLRGANLRGADLCSADLCSADLRGADLRGADLYGADLYGADLCSADLDKLPTAYINECSRDILFILEHLKSEVPGLKKALLEGRVDGSQYEGDCACLIGTLGNVDGGIEKVCEAIPFYEKGTHNPGESFFLNIRKGDTPETNSFSKHAVMLCDMVIGEL
jgi:hypothetical protein